LLTGQALALIALVSVRVRRRAAALAIVAGGLLALRAIDSCLLVMPARGHVEPRFVLTAVGAWLGVAGLFTGVFSHLLVRESLVAERDPRLPESIHFDRL
jgi:hypothetical protein